MTMPSVIAIQHISAEPLGTVAEALTMGGVAIDAVRVDLGQAVPRELGPASGLVIMGGPMGVYEADRFPFLRDELRLIEDALRRNVPIVGICLGSQLLAAALGSRVFRSGIKEIGWAPVELSAAARSDSLLASSPTRFEAFHWHGDTFDLPSGATRLASSAKTREQAFRHGDRAWGLQFHLEVTGTVVDAMALGGGEELASAGVQTFALTQGVGQHGAALQSLARTVFGRFAGLVRATAER